MQSTDENIRDSIITHEYILNKLKDLLDEFENSGSVYNLIGKEIEMIIEKHKEKFTVETINKLKKVIQNEIDINFDKYIKTRKEMVDILSKMTNTLAKFGEEINKEKEYISKLKTNTLLDEYKKTYEEILSYYEKAEKTRWL